MKIITDVVDPVDGAAEALGAVLAAAKDQSVLLLLSGGSAFAILERLSDTVFARDLTVAMLDERVSEAAAVNNFAQLRQTEFYAQRAAAGVTFFDSRPRLGEPAAALASRFEDFLRVWYGSHPGGVTVATLGMGTDGHTAGIFPGHVSNLKQGGKWVAACTLPAAVNPYPLRVTVTPQFLTTKIDQAVALVTGKAKQPALRTVLSGTVSPEVCPAVLWHQVPNLVVVTDCVLP
jgi:6-phosphogluconolactonase/glucosamine-6-phosphate isomerase/deaminase